MPRPPMPVGTHGKIRITRLGPKKYRAECRYRDFSGKVYEVERTGASRTDAENRLKAAVRDWVSPVAGAEITASARFRDVAVLWLAEVERDAEREFRSWGTVDTYRNRLEGIVLPAVGDLRMNEVSTRVFDALCKRVRDASSASSAKTVRAVLSGVCDYAIRNGALESNPAREITRLESRRAKNKPVKSRALSAAEALDLLGKLDADPAAVQADLPDLVRFFLATGERTGEALCAHWADLDESARELTMSGNVIRARGKGRVVNRGKTENAIRPIPLPDWCTEMLVERRAKAEVASGLIFPSSTGTIREATNVRNRAWKPFLVRAGYEWVTFRTFRRTVATLLDEAGLTARQIADILGHSRPSMTQDVYMGRRVRSRAGADALSAVIRENAGGEAVEKEG
ncbi:tyrosine-type recombinase/integrase [Actinosynnema pretiosum]|uniref:Site-specific integrase n=1 Tax=Actinosynnema pretiosum TaxID=42197 RepID=A0A290ZF08_9PSEU|nr:site-specific integrase [Actinosynnema pretiosum]ATE57630.1 site-specific integrase [Actinosynnema pretiosum]